MNHLLLQRLSRLVVILIFLLVITAARAAETRYWQLTFTYGPQALVLERAALIPPVDKVIRTPGLDDATVRMEYDLEWIGAQGQVVMRLPVTIPLRGRVIMGDGPRPAPFEQT